MKLTQLLEQHHKFKKHGLEESLGDGYLVAHNRFYRQVRTAALAAGYRFDKKKNEAYEAFSLLQLENLLREKIFPYANNTVAFEHLTTPELEALYSEDLEENLKRNFVFHEASHGIARNLAESILGPIKRPQDLDSQRDFALRLLLEESCANTCELLGIVDVGDKTHRFFFSLNSYMENFESRTHLKNALINIGDTIVIKFMLLSYLQSNFLREGINDHEFKEMVILSSDGKKLDPQQLKALRALSKVAFELSERFRVQTTSFHLRLAGVKTPPTDLFEFDFYLKLKTPAYARFLEQWSSILSG